MPLIRIKVADERIEKRLRSLHLDLHIEIESRIDGRKSAECLRRIDNPRTRRRKICHIVAKTHEQLDQFAIFFLKYELRPFFLESAQVGKKSHRCSRNFLKIAV